MKKLTLLFLDRDQELLLAMKKRGFGVGLYNGAGGKQDLGETIEQTAIRECQEEIGVTPTDFRLCAELIFRQDDHEDMLVYCYLCRSWQGDPSESEEMKPKWFPKNKLPFSQMWPDDQLWLPLVLMGHKLRGEFVFDDQNKIIDWSLKSYNS